MASELNNLFDSDDRDGGRGERMSANKLYYGDNLRMMREHVTSESVDLVYLDPPFNSDRNYNVLFKEKSGEASPSQIEAFTDTWQWDAAARVTYDDLITAAPMNVRLMIAALRELLGKSDMMAYLVMMSVRLIELHRVLKSSGSLYLHCDPTASHYLKIVLDTIFRPQDFRSEIIWRRTSAHSDGAQGRKNYGHIHDVLLFYTKSGAYTWNPLYTAYDLEYVDTFYRHIEPGTGRRFRLGDLTAAKPGGDTSYEWKGIPPYKGRYWAYSKARMEQFDRDGRLVYTAGGMPNYKRYLDEMPGVPLQDVWADIAPTGSKERLGYPTQKPLALLERIITTSSSPGDVVLDPFCGCGTAVVAAQKLGRQWIGIDLTHLAIALMRNRLTGHFGDAAEYDVEGQPNDMGSAQALALQDRYDFQLWALSLVGALPADGKLKKGADKGVDGLITFVDDPTEKLKRCIVQVKSGGVGAKDVRELGGTIQGNADMGLFITLEPTTRPMRDAAAEAEPYYSPYWGRPYPGIQLMTVADLLAGAKPDLPPTRRTFQQAERIAKTTGETQPNLFPGGD